jgi:DNA-binding MarR family transcriptional regulator
MTHPTRDLDDVVHQRSRLGILATLSEGSRVQFGYLQQTLGLTDGNLSRHLQTLAEAGYVQIDKGYQGNRPRTWIQITPAGRKALRAEIALLRALVDRVDESEGHHDRPAAVDGASDPVGAA